MHWHAEFGRTLTDKGGVRTAAVLMETLSAPAMSMRRHIVDIAQSAPTVNG